MEKKDRIALNNRFIEVFHLLKEQGKFISNDRKKGMSNFAAQVLGNKQYGHLVNKFLNAERYISYKYAKRFCEVYGVSEQYMFSGEGGVFEDSSRSLTNVALTSGEIKTPNVLFSNIEAFASSTVDVNVYEDSEQFRIPGLQGQHIAFYINGDSMSPTIRDGDMVICRDLGTVESLRENDIYAIVTSSSVFVKRVQKVYNVQRQLTDLKLISDNYLEHDPFFVSIKEVRKLLKVERRMTDLYL